jgi:diguanylate cyclase (GGDEF)-like protein/PAS domain S-box-containing protein
MGFMNTSNRVRTGRAASPPADRNDRFRAVFDAAADGMFISDAVTGRVIDVNEAGCRMFGYARDELVGSSIGKLASGVRPYTQSAARRLLATARMQKPQTVEWHVRTKEHALLWVEIAVRRLQFGGMPAILAVVRDIAERKTSTEALRRTEEALTEAQALVHVGSWQFDLLTHQVDWSEECFKIFGLDPLSFTPTFEAYLAHIHPDDREALTKAQQQSMQDGRPHTLDQRIVTENGDIRTVQQRWQCFYGADGAPVRISGTIQDVTERKSVEDALTQERDLSTALIDTLPGLFVVFDRHGRITRVNKTLAAMSGFSEKQLRGREALSFIAPEDHQIGRAKLQEGFAKGVVEAELAVIPKDGGKRTIRWSGRLFSDQGGASLVAVGIDVTDAHEADLQLRISEERFKAVANAAEAAIIVTDSAGAVTYWNAAAERIFGYSSSEALGRNVHEWLAPQRFRRKARAGMRAFAATGHGEVIGSTRELMAIRSDGTEFPIELSVSGVHLGTEWHAVAVLRDITQRRLAEEQAAHIARHDTLTGLVNRSVFVDLVQEAIALEGRGGKTFAVLYLDLDYFKDINDTLGHPIGDELLWQVGQRLQKAVRKADTVSRFGGDEFAIIATGIDSPRDAEVLADKILKAIARPFTVQGNEIRTAATIGIAANGTKSPDAETLLSNADIALYRAKSNQRGTYEFFTEAMDAQARSRVALIAELREAIAQQQLSLVYQPQIDVDTGRVIGVEALVRWQHATRGLVSPDDFIPDAERNGLIVPLGRWVLQEACRQMREWLDAGIAPPVIAVNVSALQFRVPQQLEAEIAAVLARNALSPKRLELELTESVFMDASQQHSDSLARLRESGIRVAIDDFGTGYSSLGYLGRFPVDRLKIGQSFTQDLAPDSNNAKIVKAAVSLAHELGLDVMVEGVDNEAQLALLRSWKCHKMQGFFFSRPLPVTEAAAFLSARAARRDKKSAG